MNITLTKSPFDSYDNILFGFIKKSLTDEHIYEQTALGMPWTGKKDKYQIQITGAPTSEIHIDLNDQPYLDYEGFTTYTFYILPQLPKIEVKNEIKVYNSDRTILLGEFRFDCYNLNIFLALTAYKFKEIWNKIYQSLANIFIDKELVTDLDATKLKQEGRYSRAIGKLLGTKRYTELTNDEYITFLHNIFDMHKYGGRLRGFYEIQQALPAYINRIDLIPMEKYLVNKNDLVNVLPDTDDSTKLKIYPTYVFLDTEEWGIINYTNENPDSSNFLVADCYVDGEKYEDTTNIGSLKVKYSIDPEFYRREYDFTDVFTEFGDDTNGEFTGIEGCKYVCLTKPILDDSALSFDSTGSIEVDESMFLMDNELNIVSLGNRYSTEIDNVKVTYKTYEQPNQLAEIVIDTTTDEILSINKAGLEPFDQDYLSYFEDNYGAVVIVIRAPQRIDDELKDVISRLIRDSLPIHIKYYIKISTVGIWNYWGQDDLVFSDFNTGGRFEEIVFEDLG